MDRWMAIVVLVFAVWGLLSFIGGVAQLVRYLIELRNTEIREQPAPARPAPRTATADQESSMAVVVIPARDEAGRPAAWEHVIHLN